MPPFNLPSSDPELLTEARRIAVQFAEARVNRNIVGIVFLGGIARGYFDRHADIDIAIFERDFAPGFQMTFHQVDGIEVQFFHLDFDREREAVWDTSKRWAYTTAELYRDPTGAVRELLSQKVPLTPEERDGFIVQGMALSDWYVNDLPQVWLDRGDLLNAHFMLGEGLDQFLQALFALNGQLTPAHKWRVYLAQRLERLPQQFARRLAGVMAMRELDEAELQRRQRAFRAMWQEMLPLAEERVGKPYREFIV